MMKPKTKVSKGEEQKESPKKSKKDELMSRLAKGEKAKVRIDS